MNKKDMLEIIQTSEKLRATDREMASIGLDVLENGRLASTTALEKLLETTLAEYGIGKECFLFYDLLLCGRMGIEMQTFTARALIEKAVLDPAEIGERASEVVSREIEEILGQKLQGFPAIETVPLPDDEDEEDPPV